jgi:hypothetical protein
MGDIPVSGRVTAIDVDPTDSGIVYVGTAQGGVYRTTDGGATWTALMDTATSLVIGAVAVDPADRTIVFVGTGEGNLGGDTFWGVGLYRINNANGAMPVVNGPFETRVAGTGTTDGGGHAFIGTAINKIVIDPNNDNRIFVGNSLGESGISGEINPPGTTIPPGAFIGLYFSANAKAAAPTFSRVDFPTFNFNGCQAVTDIVFQPGSSDIMLVGVEDFSGTPLLSGICPTALGLNGIYRTGNASVASQNPSTAPNFTRPVSHGLVNTKLAIYNDIPPVPSVVYAATGTGNGRLLRSADSGLTFADTLAAANGFCGGQCLYDIGIAVDPGPDISTTDDIIYLGGSATSGSAYLFQRSTDGGATFGDIANRLHADVHAIIIAPSNSATVYTGNDGGVWRWDNTSAPDGVVFWQSLNNATFSATQFVSLSVHPTDANFTIGGTQDNGTPFRKPDATWFRADFGDGGYSLIDQNAPNNTDVRMYHTYFNSTRTMTFGGLIGYATVGSTANAMDGMWTFRGCNNGNGNGINCLDGTLFYAPLARGPGNPNPVYFGTDHLYRSANLGANHNEVSQDPIMNGAVISAIGISPQDDTIRIVGLTNGGIYATTNGANMLDSIDPVGAGSVVPDKYVARAVIDPTDVDTAYVTLDGYTGAANHVWKTNDFVEHHPTPTWVNASGAGETRIPDVPVNAFVVDPANPTYLYAGTDIGVYISTDSGDTWNPLGSGLPKVAVFDMAIPPGNRVLRIATHGRGLWEIALPLQFVQGASRITHGAAGTFDILAPGVECRKTGGEYSIVFKFTNPITNGAFTVTEGTANIDTVHFFQNEVTVNLDGVADQQYVTLTGNNITDTNGNTIGPVEVRIGFLIGDVSGDGDVNAADIAMAKVQTGQNVTSLNFRADVVPNGALNASDIAAVKAASGNGLP